MTEEELREYTRNELQKMIKENLDSSMIFTYIQNLENKIDKAIEYIENNIDDYMADFEAISIKYDLLKILKGENEND